MRRTGIALSLLWAASMTYAQDSIFKTDPSSPELQALAKSMAADESMYGCGPLLKPGTTYYVSVEGNDKADGLSWPSAWRQVSHGISGLKAGDTLVIGEGNYVEPQIEMNVKTEQSGEPGRPITIMAAPRHRVTITCAVSPGPFRPTPGSKYTFEAEFRGRDGLSVWEEDTLIELQQVGDAASVEELPATFFHDQDQGRLYLHFSDSRGPDSHSAAVRPGRYTMTSFQSRDGCGLDIRGSYVCFKGIWFKHDNAAMVLRGNDVRDKDGKAQAGVFRGGDHITIENCAFFSTEFAGLLLYAGARWCLIKNNYGALNGSRGSILINHPDATDNLFIGNWLDPSPQTIRTRGKHFHYGISNYGMACPRNHILNNVMNDTRSFRTKFLFKQCVIQGNVMVGEFYTYPYTYKKSDYRPEERVVVRNNTLLGPVISAYQPMGPGGAAGNWAGPYKVFVNNIAVDQQSKAKGIDEARFADPAYVDYRLQSDSPLIGKALGGGDLGAYRMPVGRVLYVSPTGDDGATGTSVRSAFRTLGKAAGSLRAGDTLYVMPGDYSEKLEIRASGRAGEPICVRAYGKNRIMLPALVVSGSHVIVEGFTFERTGGDAVAISGDGVTVRDCLFRDGDGSGIRASSACDVSVLHCTLVNNAFGVVVERESTNAVIRDCILVDNREGAVALSEDSRQGFLASNNCYFGGALDKDRIAGERRSVIADPKFADQAQHDYRLQWDSPAAHLAAFARPAGAFDRLPKPPKIADVCAANLRPDFAAVLWATPEDDTTGTVQYRVKGSTDWAAARDPEQGTIHGVGVAGLNPDAEYEIQVTAVGRRGGSAVSEIGAFKTPKEGPPSVCYYLSPKGDDAADGRSPETAWRSVRKVCFQVAAGDTVLVSPGEYHHPIAPLASGRADQRITFKRHGDGEVVIDGRDVVAPLVDLQGKSHVTIDGLIFTNSPREGHPGVITLRNCVGVEILNCRIGHKRTEGGLGSGVIAKGCTGLRLEGNTIWGTRYHIQSYGCTESVIRSNTFLWGQVYSVQFSGKHTGTALINNIFYHGTSVPNPTLAIFSDSKNIELQSDYNLFCPRVFDPDRPKAKIAMVYGDNLTPLVPGETLAEWQQSSGLDRHSIHADPMFVDEKKGDFRLKPGSPAIGAGEGGKNIGACGVAE